MLKKSFTIFEILVSMVVLALVFSIIIKLFTTNDTVETYYQLQEMENQYNETRSINSTNKIVFQ